MLDGLNVSMQVASKTSDLPLIWGNNYAVGSIAVAMS